MKLAVRPTGETQDDSWNDAFKCKPPSFKYIGWSNTVDMTKVENNIEVRGSFKALPSYNDSSGYFISCEIKVLPGQFHFTKLITFYPRFIIQNQLPLLIEVDPLYDISTPSLNRDKHTLRNNDRLIIYSFRNSAKQFRVKDVEALEWMPESSFLNDGDFDIWCHQNKFDGPLIKVTIQQKASTFFAILSDNSKTPAARIENRSTVQKIVYTFQGQESILPPQTWHSMAFSNLTEDKTLKIFIGSNAKALNVNIFQVRKISKVWNDPKSNAALYSEVYIDGPTHVLSFCDVAQCNADRLDAISSNLLTNISVNLRLRGFGLTICDAEPKELMNITVDEIMLLSLRNSRSISLSVLHVQVSIIILHNISSAM